MIARLLKFSPHLVSLVTIILITTQFTHSVSAVDANLTYSKLPSTSKTTLQKQVESYTPIKLSVVTGWNLFGKASVQNSSVKTVKNNQARKTNLRLKLLGVFSAPNTQLGHAIIAGKSGSKHYRVGDRIKPGIVLTSVRNNHIELSNHGISELLFLNEQALTRQKNILLHKSLKNNELESL